MREERFGAEFSVQFGVLLETLNAVNVMKYALAHGKGVERI